MLINLFIFINSTIFLLLAVLHFYWASGGQWGIQGAIPDIWMDTFLDQKNRIVTAIATVIVALGLVIFSIVMSSNYFDLSICIDEHRIDLATRIIGGIFILRAIGDFRFVGIFKNDSKSKFATNDSKYYVPLCLYLGVSIFLISVFSK